MSQHWNCLIAWSKWSTSGLRQWLCIYFVSALPLGAFDTVDHSILASLSAALGCSGMVLDWFISYLSCHTQFVFVGHESTPSVLKRGVLQGSVLGPLLFTLNTHPLRTIVCPSGLSYNFFADDSQLHKSSVPSDFPVVACCLKDCWDYLCVQWYNNCVLWVHSF